MSVDAATGARRAWAIWLWRLSPLLAITVYAALQVVAIPHWEFNNDSYRYARHALEFLGVPPVVAQDRAVAAFCLNQSERDAASGGLRAWDVARTPPDVQSQTGRCIRRYSTGLPPTQPAYERIFDTRPGYPLLVASFALWLGVLQGMWLASLLITVVSALLVWMLTRIVGLSPPFALAAEVAFLVSPLAAYSMDPMTEGAVTMFLLLSLMGAWLLGKGWRGWWGGVPCLVVGLVGLGAVKYSTLAVFSAGLVVVGLLWLVVGRRSPVHWPGALLVIFLSSIAVALTWWLSKQWSLPGLDSSLQDSFTYHFLRPPVADPWPLLQQLEANYWRDWIAGQASAPLLLVLLPLAVVATWRWHPRLALLTGAVGIVGLLLSVVHPFASQGERLWVLLWFPVVLGVGPLLAWLRGERPTNGSPQTRDAATEAAAPSPLLMAPSI